MGTSRVLFKHPGNRQNSLDFKPFAAALDEHMEPFAGREHADFLADRRCILAGNTDQHFARLFGHYEHLRTLRQPEPTAVAA